MIMAACQRCNTMSVVRNFGATYYLGNFVGICTVMHVKPGNTEATQCEGNLEVVSISQ